ncbi:MAG: diguanylate cyclase [Planctomycetes bacterium]|nr:diguanylate cyclase [Planctomycetota bacterium]
MRSYLLLFITASCASRAPITIEPSQLQLKFETGIRSILEDNDGNLWIGSHMEGVAKFDGGKVTYFTTEDGLSNNQVRRMKLASDGVVWFETGKGISSFDGTRVITHTDKNYQHRTDWEVREGDLWFKADATVGFTEAEGKPGVYRYDGSELLYLEFPMSENEDSDTYYSVVTHPTYASDGKVWFGTYGAAIGFDGHAFTLLDNEFFGRNKGEGFLHIRSLLADRNGNLWIGNNGIGVIVYDGVDFTHFSAEQGLRIEDVAKEAPNLGRVFALAEDRNGNIWFGTSGHGIWKYDGKSMVNFGVEQGVASKHIWTFYEDRRGDLWVGGADPSALYRFDGGAFVDMNR